jgi:hypothetical protein
MQRPKVTLSPAVTLLKIRAAKQARSANDPFFSWIQWFAETVAKWSQVK